MFYCQHFNKSFHGILINSMTHYRNKKKNPKYYRHKMNTEKLTVKLHSTAVFEITNRLIYNNCVTALMQGKLIKFGEVLVGR